MKKNNDGKSRRYSEPWEQDDRTEIRLQILSLNRQPGRPAEDDGDWRDRRSSEATFSRNFWPFMAPRWSLPVQEHVHRARLRVPRRIDHQEALPVAPRDVLTRYLPNPETGLEERFRRARGKRLARVNRRGHENRIEHRSPARRLLPRSAPHHTPCRTSADEERRCGRTLIATIRSSRLSRAL